MVQVSQVMNTILNMKGINVVTLGRCSDLWRRAANDGASLLF